MPELTIEGRRINPYWLNRTNSGQPRRTFRMPAGGWKDDLLALLPKSRSLRQCAATVGVSRQAVYLAMATDQAFADRVRAIRTAKQGRRE
jgi:hypothetical protein